MSLAHVQSIAKARVAGGTSCTTGGVTTTSGNGVAVIPTVFTGSAFSSVADSKSNAWSTAVGPVSYNSAGVGSTRIMYNTNITGGASHTFTLNLSSSEYAVLSVIEFSGQEVGGTHDQTGSQNTSTDGVNESGTTGTTTQANEILIAAMSSSTAAVTTISAPSDSFTAAIEEEDAVNYVLAATAWRIVGATGTYSTTWTLGASRNACGCIATFKEAAAAASTSFVCSMNPLAAMIGR